MAATLKNVLGDPNTQQRMIELGLNQASEFHPDRVVLQVQAFWDGLAACQPSPPRNPAPGNRQA
jgi:predicted component of type VI protein secretion system